MTDYSTVNAQVAALTGDEPDALAATSNFVAILYNALADINWLGVYVLRGSELVLGPFQGQPACVHIAVGAGVCGVAAATRSTQRVADVHAFEGHIVCDPVSRSELVVPLLVDDQLIGVLDIDSPLVDRFGHADQVGVERLCRTFCNAQHKRAEFI